MRDHKHSGTLLESGSLEHIGIAVRSIAAAHSLYAAIGLKVSHEETIEHEHVRVAMLQLGDSRIELLEPTAPNSVIARFLDKRGGGLHHIAIKTTDITELFAHLTAQGIRLASTGISVGAGGQRYFFIHPKSTGGVLIEIVE